MFDRYPIKIGKYSIVWFRKVSKSQVKRWYSNWYRIN